MKRKLLPVLLSIFLLLSLMTPVTAEELTDDGDTSSASEIVTGADSTESTQNGSGANGGSAKADSSENEVVPAPESTEEEPGGSETPTQPEQPDEPEQPQQPQQPQQPDYANMSPAELYAALSALSDEDAETVYESLSEEQQDALDEYLESLNEEVPEEEASASSVVDFTDAAPFLPPVTGPAGRRLLAAASVPAGTDAAGVETRKTVTYSAEDGYQVRLESWVTGASHVVSQAVPCDIVLVLDQSGSMATEDFPVYTYTAYDADTTNGSYYNNQSNLWISLDSETYAQVTVSRTGRNGTYTYTYTSNGTMMTISSSGRGGTLGTTLYKRSQTGTEFRLTALQAAANAFISSVHAKALGPDHVANTDDDVDHRIAVVGFASGQSYDGSNYNYGNTELFVGSTQYPYNAGSANSPSNANSAQSHYGDAFQSAKTDSGMTQLRNSIGALSSDGGTLTNLGMEMANGIFTAYPVPTGKQRNRVVIVFTDGEPGWNGYDSDIAAAAISIANTTKAPTTSGGYGATVYTIGIFDGADASSAGSTTGSGTDKANWFMQHLSSNNGTVQTPSYYLTTGSTNTLGSIFQNISQNIGGADTEELTGTTIVKDVLSPYFKLPDGTDASGIHLYTADCTGDDGSGNLTWGSDTAASGPAAQVAGKTVSVSGFDFSVHWCGSHNGTYSGEKLIVVFPITPETGFLGGNNVPTNTSDSGLYRADDSVIETFVIPTANVTIPVPSVDVHDKSIYYGGSVSAGDLYTPMATDGADSWKYDYVTIGYSGLGAISSTDCGDYPVTATVSPSESAAPGSAGPEATAQSGTSAAHVHVFIPHFAVTAQDVWADYGASVPLSSWGLTQAGGAPAVAVTWADKGGHTADFPAGDAPVIAGYSSTFAKDSGDGTLSSGTYSVGLTDADFSLTGLFCTVGGLSYPVPAGDLNVTKAVSSEGHDFTVHLNHFRMTIQKSATGSGLYYQNFLFSVADPVSGNAFPVVIPFTQTAQPSRTVFGLVCGKTYTVTEDAGWSWRYNTQQAKQVTAQNPISNTAPAEQTVPVSFSNSLSNSLWLSGSYWIANLFHLTGGGE